MTGSNKVWRAPVAGLASVAMLATLGVSALTANAADSNVTVTFEGNGLNLSEESAKGVTVVDVDNDTITVTASKGTAFSTFSAAVKTQDLKTGAFTAWYNTDKYGVKDSAVVSTETVDANMTVYAHWTPSDDGYYNVLFNANGIVSGGSNSFKLAKDDVIDPDQVPSVDKAGDGQLLSGWSYGEGGVTADPTTMNLDLAVTTGTNKIEFTAQAEEAWTVAFMNATNANSAAVSNENYKFYIKGIENTVESVKYDVKKGAKFNADSSHVVPDAYTKGNKKASFWTTSQTTGKETVDDLSKFDPSAEVNEDLELYPAKGEQYCTYTLHYGDYRTTKDTTLNVVEGEPIVVPDAGNYVYDSTGYGKNDQQQKVHYTFDGWYTDDGYTKPLASDAVASTDGDHDLYAKWVVSEVGIDFHSNYGTDKTETAWFKDGSTFSAPEFEREGFVITGWKASQDAQNTDTSGYAAWENTTLTVKNGGLYGYYAKDQSEPQQLKATEFYAVWGADPSYESEDLRTLLAKLEAKVDVTKNGAYIKGDDQTQFTADSFDQYVKDYQSYLSSKGDPKTNEDYAKLIDKLEALQANLVEVGDTSVIRLYNQYNGDHLYTINEDESQSLQKIGWTLEGPQFKVVTTTSTALGTPVYRLYNPYSGEHLLTADDSEVKNLESMGWQIDGEGKPVFYAPQNGAVEVTRLYNPYETGSGAHLYTTNQSEIANLTNLGWLIDGVIFSAQ